MAVTLPAANRGPAPGRPAPAARHAGDVPGARRAARAATLAALVAGPVAGVLLIARSYQDSLAGGDATAFTAWFWAGTACGCLPVGTYLVSARPTGGQRLLAVAALAAFTFAPKYLRNAGGPLYFDERAHWVQVRSVVDSHHLFVPNDGVPIVRFYPGLHALTAALTQVTGLDVWTVAELVGCTVHVLAALGVYLLVSTLTGPRGAGVAAAVYVTNPEWVYFDTQFAYESLGVALVVWTLYFTARLDAAADPGPGTGSGPGSGTAERVRWAGLAAVTAIACVLTHHLSATALCAVLVGCTAASAALAVRGDRPWSRVAWTAVPTGVACAVLAGWLAWVAPATADYLGSSVSTALGQLTGLLTAAGDDGSRTPFSGSQAPPYERLAAFAAPLLVAVLVGRHLIVSRALRDDARRGLALPLSLLACAYLASVPLVLTAAGSEPARRSWAFTYLGVAAVAGRTFTRERGAPGRGHRPGQEAGRRRAGSTALVAGAAVLAVGNLAAGENIAYRFPGPYVFGSDSRSVTVNMLDARRWWQGVRAPGSGVVADRYNGVLYQAVPGTRVASAQEGPVTDLYLTANPVSPWFARSLADGGFDYLVVDNGMTRAVPLLGVYFAPDEPAADGAPLRPVDPAFLDRWATTPWTTRVYDSDDITVYRLDPRAATLTWRRP